MISRVSEQGAGLANLRKREKTNGLVGAKNRGRGRPKGKEKTNGLEGLKNKGRGGPT